MELVIDKLSEKSFEKIVISNYSL